MAAPTDGNKFEFFKKQAEQMYRQAVEALGQDEADTIFGKKKVVMASNVKTENDDWNKLPDYDESVTALGEKEAQSLFGNDSKPFKGLEKELQMFLQELDLYHGKIDGILGKKSNEAIAELRDEYLLSTQEIIEYSLQYTDMLPQSETPNYINTTDKRIALVVGHRSGAKGATNTDGVSEYDFWSKFLNKHIDTFERLTGNDYEIFYRRDDDGAGYTARIEALTERINEYNPHLTISCHFNSFSGNASGFEILCTEATSSQASKLLNYFDKALKGKNRGVKIASRVSNGAGFLYRANNSILIEPFFGSHRIDTNNFMDTEYKFVQCLVDYFNTI